MRCTTWTGFSLSWINWPKTDATCMSLLLPFEFSLSTFLGGLTSLIVRTYRGNRWQEIFLDLSFGRPCLREFWLHSQIHELQMRVVNFHLMVDLVGLDPVFQSIHQVEVHRPKHKQCEPYPKWMVSKNTQTPKFQIFPGRLGSSKRKNLGVCPKNRKGGRPLSIPNVENLFENLFVYCIFLWL